MKNTLRVFVPVLFSILAFGASAPSAFAAATLNVNNSDSASVNYRNTIVKAADLLLSQQNNNDGGWKWDVTTGATTPSDWNNFGVTALGLLNAYQLTHDAKYLTGATLTANHLVGMQTPTDLATDNANRFISSDIEFLAKIGQVTSNTDYSNKATALMNHFLSQPNRYCASGCGTAQNIADYYHRVDSKYPGYAEWSISDWVIVAKLTGHDTWGIDLANIVKEDVLASAYVPTLNSTADNYYTIGLGAALGATSMFPVGNADISIKLVAEQNVDTGAMNAYVSDGIDQATAYSVLGFSAAGDSTHAIISANFFLGNHQDSDGGWTTEDGTHKYTEINSEIIQAIFSVLPANTYYTIQDAINAANPGDTINVGAGNYIEQLTIDKNLTLIGAGEDKTTIQSPNTLTSKFVATINSVVSSMKPVITIKGVDANISALKVDGNGKGDSVNNTFFVGIGFYNAGGSLDHVTVAGVKETPPSRDYQGDAVRATDDNGSSHNLSITNSTISDFQKNGITLSGAGLTVTVSGNHVTGSGSNDQVAQNGIVLGTGVTGSVTGNTVKDLMCDDSTCGSDWYHKSQAIALALVGVGSKTASGNTISNSDIGIYSELTSGLATITNNTLTNNRWFGMLFEAGDVAVSGGSVTGGGSNAIGIFNPSEHNSGNTTVHNVNISGNSIAGLKNDAASLSVDATNNWWGSATPVFADIISGTVSNDPWFTNAGMTTLNTYSDTTVTTVEGAGQANLSPGITNIVLDDSHVLDLSNATSTITLNPVTIGDNTVDLTQSVVLQSGIQGEDVVLTNSNPDVAGITASIPDGTTISGPAEWDGTIMPPTSGTPADGNAPAGFSVGGTVISIGSPDGTLVFNKTVTIVLPNVTGTVGYRPSGSNDWIQITNICDGTYDTPTDPTAPGECSINNGTNTKIVTYHFTSFGEFIPDQTQPGNNGGGNGNGSILSIGSGIPNPLPGAAVNTPAVNATSVAQEKAQGRVLGAATYNFTKALAVGSRGADVTALQQFLIDGGFSIPAGATGYYGAQTRAAVVAFQKARGIAQVGVVGPLTRGELNKGVTPTSEAAGKTNLSAGQVDSILSLIESFGADASVIAKVRASLGR